METSKTISIKDLYQLIDLYKKATINGEKTDLIISYPYENGAYDFSKRIVSIAIKGGFYRDRDSFIVDSEEFDKYFLPEIVDFYSYDDSLSNWDVDYVSLTNIYKGVNETLSGNTIYIESKEDIYDTLKSKNSIEKKEFTNNDKVWNEIINYTKERRRTLDYYRSVGFSRREIGAIYNFVDKLSEEKKINVGSSKKNKENNINYVEEFFKDKEKVLSLGLNEELYDKIVKTSTIRQLAVFTGFEKKLKKRVNKDDQTIKEKIKFAIDELDKVDYFNLKNASYQSFKNGNFLVSKPYSIIQLKHIYDGDEFDYELSTKYKEYCDEILEFLERNAKRNAFEYVKKIEKNVKLEKYNDVVLDSYDELWDAVSLVMGARVNDEKYEIIVENNKENGNKVVRISVLGNLIKTDTFKFEFSDKEKFNVEFSKIEKMINEFDPMAQSITKYSNDKELTLKKTNEGNELLNKIDKNNKTEINNNESNLKIADNNNDTNKLNKIKDTKINNIENDLKTFKDNKINNLKLDDIVEKLKNAHENKYEEKTDIKDDNTDKITKEKLLNLEKVFSDYLMGKESKERKSEFVEIPFMNMSIATFELLSKKYKDKLNEMYQNNLLPKEEKKVIDNIQFLKNKLEIYYNETVDRSASLIEEEVKRLANCEVALATIYEIESDNKYNENSNKPSELLKIKVNKDEYKENNNYIDNMTDLYINKYRSVLEKYNNPNSKYDEKELIADKDTLLQVITYKMKLKDAYDNIISKNNLTDEDLALLAKYERILYDIYEIDSKYQENIKEKIDELKNQEKFLTPSSKIYLSSLEKEYNKNKENDKSEYLFEVIKQNDENDYKEDEEETIKNAYYKYLINSNKDNPLSISIVFDRNDKNNAELIISNMDNKKDGYKKSVDYNKVKELLPLLCDLFSENDLEYAFKYNMATSNDLCLLGLTKDKKTFKIMYADDEIIDYAKNLLDDKLDKEEGKIK